MTLNFQNKIVFPAPDPSYTTETAFGQVIYVPRNILTKKPGDKSKENSDANKKREQANNYQPRIDPKLNEISPTHEPTDTAEAEKQAKS